MNKISRDKLTEFLFHYDITFHTFGLLIKVDDLGDFDSDELDKDQKEVYNLISSDNMLDAIRDDFKWFSNVEDLIMEIRTNTLNLSDFKDLKKYHFYIQKQLIFFEQKHIKVFEYLNTSNTTGDESKLGEVVRKYLMTWIGLKERIKKEIDWEIEETIKFERELDAKFDIDAIKTEKKIKWLAGVAYLGHLIDELERNGFIDFPGCTSREKKANFLLTIFDTDTTIGSLAKELSETTNSLTADSKGRIIIRTPLKSKKN